jgi:hypothetical protein
MTQQTFAVGEKPQVQITQIDGSLTVQTWQERSISVETTGMLDGVRQDGDTVIISDYKGDLVLWVPALRNGFRWITTDVSVTHLTGDSTIEGAGQVVLNDIGGNVTLKNIAGSVELENVGAVTSVTNIGGSLHAASMPTLLARKGIGGEMLVSDVARLEVDAVGGSAELNKVGTATIHAVGGNLDVEGIETLLRCNAVGGDCHVHNSANAEINITNVGGNLQMEGSLRGHMSNIGGNLYSRVNFPPGSSTHFHVGGNANVELSDDASVALHAIVGGQVSGEALGSSRGGSFANLVYGDGAARLSLIVGGNLRLLGSIVPRRTNMGESWNHFGREMAGLGREMGRIGHHVGREVAAAFKESGRSGRWSAGKHQSSSTYAQDRAAILRMVAQGRITPEEGNMLLSGLRD